jgi:hypothetical protein
MRGLVGSTRSIASPNGRSERASEGCRPPAEGVGVGRHHYDGGGQPLDRRVLSAGPQRGLCGDAREIGSLSFATARLQEEHRSVTKASQMARTHSASPAQPAVPAYRAATGCMNTRTPADDLSGSPSPCQVWPQRKDVRWSPTLATCLASAATCGFVDNASRCQQSARPTTTEAVNRWLRKAVTLTRQRQSGLAGHLNSQAFAPLLGTHCHPPSDFVNPQRADQNSPSLGPPSNRREPESYSSSCCSVPRLLTLAFVQLSRNQPDQDQDSPFTVDAFQDPCGCCGDLQ